MTRLLQKGKRPQVRALVLLGVLGGICVSAIISQIWLTSQASAPNRVSLLARLSLVDSAFGRLDSRALNPGSKSYRRQPPISPLLPNSNISPLEVSERRMHAFDSEQSRLVILISPPGNRAPPRLLI